MHTTATIKLRLHVIPIENNDIGVANCRRIFTEY